MDDQSRSKLKDPEADPHSSWDKVDNTLKTSTPVYKPSFVHRYWMVAALSIVVLTAMWVSYQAFRTHQLAQLSDQAIHTRDGARHADGSKADHGVSKDSIDTFEK